VAEPHVTEWGDDRTSGFAQPATATDTQRPGGPVPDPPVSAPGDQAVPVPGGPAVTVAAGRGAEPSPVDAALGDLAAASGQPLDRQVAVYEAVHRVLQDTLRSIELN
jgi:hypothetical protein